MNEKRQRGAGKIATLIWLAIFVAAIYLAFKILPVYVNNYELQGLMQKQTRSPIEGFESEPSTKPGPAIVRVKRRGPE